MHFNTTHTESSSLMPAKYRPIYTQSTCDCEFKTKSEINIYFIKIFSTCICFIYFVKKKRKKPQRTCQNNLEF